MVSRRTYATSGKVRLKLTVNYRNEYLRSRAVCDTNVIASYINSISQELSRSNVHEGEMDFIYNGRARGRGENFRSIIASMMSVRFCLTQYVVIEILRNWENTYLESISRKKKKKSRSS